MWFDGKLTWKVHLEKMINKCKKIVNILRCLSGQTWGPSRASLLNIYWALMRSVFDYGCMAYISAAESCYDLGTFLASSGHYDLVLRCHVLQLHHLSLCVQPFCVYHLKFIFVCHVIN